VSPEGSGAADVFKLARHASTTFLFFILYLQNQKFPLELNNNNKQIMMELQPSS